MHRRTYEDFKKEADEYENIVKNYIKTHKKFVDPNFHPTLHIKEYGTNVDDSIENYVRLEEEYKAALFKKENIGPNFIQQGSLGDCYFLSGIGRLSMQPSLIPILFEQDIPNKYLGIVEDSINLDCGAVVIYFWLLGQRIPVLTDTLMPTKNGKLQFSSPIDKTKSAFFCLIEKAFAKLYGSYSSIISGNISIAIHSMFGNYYAIHKTINDLQISASKSKSTVFEQIMKYQNQKLAVMETFIWSDESNISEQELKNKNLHSNHSYLITKVRKVKALNGLILICLQNPWGHSEWNGDFSDYSSCWTPEAKKELKLEEKDDGTFWMNEKDFIKYFTGINLTKAITNKMNLKSFDCQFLPESNNARKNNSDLKVAFQFDDHISDGEKCKFFVLVEKLHAFYDEKGSQCKFLKYKLEFEHKNDKTISYNSIGNLAAFKHKACKNETIIISLKKTERLDIIEDCYVSVFSEYNFKLYNYNDPTQIYNSKDIPQYGYIFAPISYGHIDEQFSIIQKFEQDHIRNKEIELYDIDALLEAYCAKIVTDKYKLNSSNYNIEYEKLKKQINEIQDNNRNLLNESIQKVKDLQKEKEDLLKTIEKMKKDHKNENAKLLMLIDKMNINIKNENKMHLKESKLDLIQINQLSEKNQELNQELSKKTNELNQMKKEYDNMFNMHQIAKNEEMKLSIKCDLLSNQFQQKNLENIVIKNENVKMMNKLNKLKKEIGICQSIFDENENEEDFAIDKLEINNNPSEITSNDSETQTVVSQKKFRVVKPRIESSKSHQRFKRKNVD